MKLYVGGAHQGQLEQAERENPGAHLVRGFHEIVRGLDDPAGFVDALMRDHPDAVVVSDEIGSGVVPMLSADRAWRENVGRGLCRIAQASESVTRVVCGIGTRIK